jgi:hypothetical protein
MFHPATFSSSIAIVEMLIVDPNSRKLYENLASTTENTP